MVHTCRILFEYTKYKKFLVAPADSSALTSSFSSISFSICVASPARLAGNTDATDLV